MYGSSFWSPKKVSGINQKIKFSEPKSFRGALFPVIRSCWLFGIGIFEYPIGHPHPKLSFCWSIAHLSLYLFFAIQAEVPNISYGKGSTITHHNYHLSSCCCAGLIITAIIIARKGKTIKSCHRRIGVVNEKLRRFGIAEDYGITFNLQIKQLAICLSQIIIIVVSVYFGKDKYFADLSNIAFSLSFYYQLIFIFIIGCTYCGCIRYIGNRFQHLNADLLKSTSDGTDTKRFLQDVDCRLESMIFPITREIQGDHCVAKAANRKWTVNILREARSIHRDLCITAKEMNQAFGIHITFFIGITFCNLTSLLYTIYQIFMIPNTVNVHLQSVQSISVCCCLVIYTIAVYYLVYCSSMVSCEAQKTGVVLHNRVKPDISTEIQVEIDVFLLQLMQDPLEFTAYGFFPLDYTLIRGMVGSVATYLVIMIQLRDIYSESKPDVTNLTSFATNYTN